jgi:hypothetical protein
MGAVYVHSARLVAAGHDQTKDAIESLSDASGRDAEDLAGALWEENIRSFFHFVAFEKPAYSGHIQRVLAIPGKRGEKGIV